MTPLRTGKAALCLALFIPFAAAAQETKLTASFSPSTLPENESGQLELVLEAPISVKTDVPVFNAPDFTVMGAPGHFFSAENGPRGPNTWKKITFKYVLMPKRVGELRIGDIKATIGGEVRMASDLRVTVTPGSAAPSALRPLLPGITKDEASNPAAPGYRPQSQTALPGAQPGSRGTPSYPARFNSDFTVHAVLSKQRAYVGEPVVVEYYIYDYGHVRHVDVGKWPTFDGFWKEDLHLITQPQFEEAFVQNQEMRRAFIARYALYGIKPGKLPVDRLRIRGRYVSDDSIATGIVLGFDMRTGDHSSQELDLEVIPLPEAGRPQGFSGAVGQFALKLEANRASLPQNSPITFSLTLTGIGNFQAIESIKLPLPTDFELYDTSAIGRVAAPIGTRQELESKKTFQITAIPRKAGKFEIAPVKWSYFDPEKGTYETISTDPLTIEVSESAAGGTDNANTYLTQGTARGTGQAEAEWKPWKPVESAPEGRNWLPWLVLLAFALNVYLAGTKLRDRWRGLFQLVRKVDRFSEARIALLQAKGIRDSEWQAGLEEVLLMTMQVLLETNPRGLTKFDQEEAWKARSLPAPLFQRISALLEEIDRHRFSSQKLATGTKEMRSRLTRETESLLAEASRIKRR